MRGGLRHLLIYILRSPLLYPRASACVYTNILTVQRYAAAAAALLQGLFLRDCARRPI